MSTALRSSWSALGRLLRFGPGALVVLVRFAFRSRGPHVRAFREALDALKSGLPSVHGDPLVEVHPYVREIRGEYLRQLGMPAPADGALTFVHFPGTGEPPHALIPGLQRIFETKPALAAHRHLVVDVPDEDGALDGTLEFRRVLRRILAPVFEGTRGGLVFIGLSRGGAAALDLAAIQIREDARPIGVVALSPPIIGDYERPRTVRDFASLERTMVPMLALARAVPAWLLRGLNWVLLRSYVALLSFTLTEFEMAAPSVVRWSTWDLKQVDPIPSIVRANREFGMLLRVPDAVLHHGCKVVARAVAANEGLSVCMLWGEHDTWVPAERCVQRARKAFERAGAPAERAVAEVLPGWSHAMSRQLAPDFGELTEHVARVVARVQRVAADGASASANSPSLS